MLVSRTAVTLRPVLVVTALIVSMMTSWETSGRPRQFMVIAEVSMHGSLATANRAEPGAVAARVLVCHGALDPHVPMADVVAFTEEMTKAGADWQVKVYGGAMHGFTHARGVDGATPGVAYHAETDRRSFAAAQAFLDEALTARGAGQV